MLQPTGSRKAALYCGTRVIISFEPAARSIVTGKNKLMVFFITLHGLNQPEKSHLQYYPPYYYMKCPLSWNPTSLFLGSFHLKDWSLSLRFYSILKGLRGCRVYQSVEYVTVIFDIFTHSQSCLCPLHIWYLLWWLQMRESFLNDAEPWINVADVIIIPTHQNKYWNIHQLKAS